MALRVRTSSFYLITPLRPSSTSAIFNSFSRLDRRFNMRIIPLQLVFVLLSSAAVLDRVAVVVGATVITESEVDEELRLEQFMASEPMDLGPQQRRAAADRLV